MSPKEARIFVVEDDKYYQDGIKQVLEKAGHKVVLTSNEFFDALGKIRGGEVDKLGIQVITLDGKLSWVGGEGQLLADEIRKRKPKIKTVGLSNSIEGIDGADANVSKREMDRLGEIIDNL